MTKFSIAQKRNIFPFAAFSVASLLSLAFLLPYQASAALLTQQLDLGERNADVTSLQTFLATDNTIYPQGLVTGYFGSLTKSAVSNFQSRNNLATVGRVGPQTLAAINKQMSAGAVSGGQGGDSGNLDDVSAPVIFKETISTGTNAANISWTTSSSAISRVMFATSWPFLYSSAPSVRTNGYTTAPSITITGLQSQTTYYYVLESVDASGNVMWTVAKTFRTQ